MAFHGIVPACALELGLQIMQQKLSRAPIRRLRVEDTRWSPPFAASAAPSHAGLFACAIAASLGHQLEQCAGDRRSAELSREVRAAEEGLAAVEHLRRLAVSLGGCGAQ